MASPIRRRVAAALTCVALAFATFGYVQRTASEAAFEADRAPANCDQALQGNAEHGRNGPGANCLILFGD